MERNYLIMALSGMLVVSGCKKEIGNIPISDHPIMSYTELNIELKNWSSKAVDINNDGRKDIVFEVFPLGDPVMQQDKIQFYAYSTIHSSLLTDNNDSPPMLTKGETIKPVHPGYQWWPVSSARLAEKISSI